MTPEERFTKIENAIQALTETQAKHDSQIEKQNAGIRDLIVLSRTFLDSQKEVTSQIKQLDEAQRHTDDRLNSLNEKLAALIDTVDRFLKGMEKPNGNQ